MSDNRAKSVAHYLATLNVQSARFTVHGYGPDQPIGDNATVSLVNTILANNQENNCASASQPTSAGYNLSDDFSCGLNQSGDLQGVDPLLTTLGNYGGAVQTHALRAGSPAIDMGDNARCPPLMRAVWRGPTTVMETLCQSVTSARWKHVIKSPSPTAPCWKATAALSLPFSQ